MHGSPYTHHLFSSYPARSHAPNFLALLWRRDRWSPQSDLRSHAGGNHPWNPGKFGKSRAAAPIGVRKYQVATMRLPSTPICGDESSTTSPIFRKRFGDCAPSVFLRDMSAAVPAEVPPAMTSPGTKVKSRERYSSTSPKGQIISLVL